MLFFALKKKRQSALSAKRKQTNTATWLNLFKVMITSLCRHLIQSGFYVSHPGHSFSINTSLKFEVLPHLVSGLQKSRPTPRTSFTLASSIPEISAPWAFLASVAASAESDPQLQLQTLSLIDRSPVRTCKEGIHVPT